MTQAQLVNEFRQLSLTQQLEMLQAFLDVVAQHVQATDAPANGDGEHMGLSEAANLLLSDYEEDQELISFTILDGEPFYA